MGGWVWYDCSVARHGAIVILTLCIALHVHSGTRVTCYKWTCALIGMFCLLSSKVNEEVCIIKGV